MLLSLRTWILNAFVQDLQPVVMAIMQVMCSCGHTADCIYGFPGVMYLFCVWNDAGAQYVIGKSTEDKSKATTGSDWHCAMGNNWFIQVYS